MANSVIERVCYPARYKARQAATKPRDLQQIWKSKPKARAVALRAFAKQLITSNAPTPLFGMADPKFIAAALNILPEEQLVQLCQKLEMDDHAQILDKVAYLTQPGNKLVVSATFITRKGYAKKLILPFLINLIADQAGFSPKLDGVEHHARPFFRQLDAAHEIIRRDAPFVQLTEHLVALFTKGNFIARRA
ncbi:MAG: hypothetical protein HQ596_03720 [Candidatus Saganbacteria bacterium]|nr:hypothetical protein [Candidatus Saganbacteria bacterium]